MTTDNQPIAEANRLEDLWGGEFGDAYVDRNAEVGNVRGPFWERILQTYSPRRVLEVGCNLGANLQWIVPTLGAGDTYGIDVNQKAIEEIRRRMPAVNAVVSHARDLPFRDCWFDLSFTMGVLIHQPESTLPLVMSEVVRTSRRFILCGEYFSEDTVEVPYRGHAGALFKRNYGQIYQELFPELQLREQGFMGRDQGWDDVTFWVFEKP